MEKPKNVPQGLKSGPRPLEQDAQGCTLGREVAFDGTLAATEDLTVLGRVKGVIRAQGALIIGKEAQVDARVEGQRIVVHGRVKGHVRATERIEFGPSANMRGDIAAPVVQISEGAQFEGRVSRPGKGGQAGSLLDRIFNR